MNRTTWRRRALAIAAGLAFPAAPALAGGVSELGRGWWSDSGAHACLHCRIEAAGAADEAARSRAGHFDEATGRDLLNYPPHRFADHVHMRLEIDIPDMNTPVAHARQTLTLRPIGRPMSRLALDAPLLKVESVALASPAGEGATRVTSFGHEGDKLVVRFDPPLPVGETVDLAISYTIADPPEGLIWTPESPAWPGRPAQLHTQGQPESNRYWFPCHDFPNERMTTELIVTVPEGYEVSSNGRLVSRTPAKDAPGRETFHWFQDKDHVSYLVTLVVGKFDVVDLGGSALPMPVYVPRGKGDLVRGTYGRTGAMVEHFASLIDEPYPWDRYAQLVVHNFAAGGMENTSATTMYDTAIFDAAALLDGDLDGLIAHELAHQWFGDLLTCKSWEHIWLNEGFATYFTSLWFERRDGLDAYQAGIRGNFQSVIARDRAEAPYQPAMASKEYRHPWDVFGRAANPYPKGASVLHMLRMKLGDQVFFRGIAQYVDKHKHGAVETADLRKALEAASGLSLQRFFDQWCARPGVPHLDVSLNWDSAAGELVVGLEQTQNIDSYNPAFALDLPIWVRLPGESDWRAFTVSTQTRFASARFGLPAEPEIIAVDPELHVLARLDIDQPAERWLAQLRHGPTLAARAQAIDALRSLDGGPTAEAAAAIEAVAKDTRAHISLRTAAVEALRSHPDRLVSLALDAPEDARLRRELVEQIARISPEAAGTKSELVAGFLLRSARADRSYGVRSAAIRALADTGHREALRVALDACGTDSQHDQIRQAALSALARLDKPEGLAAAIRLAGPGVNARTRPVAISTVRTLARHDEQAAIDLLAHLLLKDREARTVSAAGDALAAIGGEKAEAALREYAAGARSGIQRSQAARWLGVIGATENAAR